MTRERFMEYWLPLGLLVATIGTTYRAGVLHSEHFYAEASRTMQLVGGLTYCIPLMVILVTHELGHYLTARRLGVDASLPFLIPLPANFFILGTLGAIIRLRDIPKDRSQLLKIGAAGPLAGGVVALAVMIVGVMTSRPGPIIEITGGVMVFGDSVATLAMAKVLWPDLGSEQTLYASPMFMAGWAGFLVTMLNLIPMGQLDGGHVGYAVFGKRINQLWWLVVLVLLGLAVFEFAGWALWAVIGVFLGRWHFAVPDEETKLDRTAMWMAILCVLLFVLMFMPAPVHMNPWEIAEMLESAP